MASLTSFKVFESLIYICCFALAGINDYSNWRAVNALWLLGNLSLNLANTFYYAGFPGVVRNLPETKKSEREVFEGLKPPEEHAQFDSLGRAKVCLSTNRVHQVAQPTLAVL
jgi:hypothetical protein